MGDIHVYVPMCAHVHAGLREASVARETDVHLANPTLPDEVLQGGLLSLLNLVTMQKCPYFYFVHSVWLCVFDSHSIRRFEGTVKWYCLLQRLSLGIYAEQTTLLGS